MTTMPGSRAVLEEMEKTDWSQYRHANGRASDLVDKFRLLLDPDHEVRDRSRKALTYLLVPDRVTVAARESIPHLLALLEADDFPEREWVLSLLPETFLHQELEAYWLRGFHSADEMVAKEVSKTSAATRRTCFETLCDAADRLLLTLASPRPPERASGAECLQWLGDESGRITPGLLAALDSEDDPMAGAALVTCAGYHAHYATLDGRAQDRDALLGRLGAARSNESLRDAASVASLVARDVDDDVVEGLEQAMLAQRPWALVATPPGPRPWKQLLRFGFATLVGTRWAGTVVQVYEQAMADEAAFARDGLATELLCHAFGSIPPKYSKPKPKPAAANLTAAQAESLRAVLRSDPEAPRKQLAERLGYMGLPTDRGELEAFAQPAGGA